MKCSIPTSKALRKTRLGRTLLHMKSLCIAGTGKAQCFYKYLTDLFYMQVFVQTNKPEQWQSMIESIYDSIEMQESNFANAKITPMKTLQPIRARTSTLGAPLASSENPMDRIAQHLGNMGI